MFYCSYLALSILLYPVFDTTDCPIYLCHCASELYSTTRVKGEDQIEILAVSTLCHMERCNHSCLHCYQTSTPPRQEDTHQLKMLFFLVLYSFTSYNLSLAFEGQCGNYMCMHSKNQDTQTTRDVTVCVRVVSGKKKNKKKIKIVEINSESCGGGHILRFVRVYAVAQTRTHNKCGGTPR